MGDTLQKVYRVTRKQYNHLAYEDGSIGTHKFDPDALYLVEDKDGNGGSGSGSGFVDGVLLMQDGYAIKYVDEFNNQHNVIYTGRDDGDMPYVKIGKDSLGTEMWGRYFKFNNYEVITLENASNMGTAPADTVVLRAEKGQIDSEKFTIVDESDSAKATLQYDSTLKAIKFIFNNK